MHGVHSAGHMQSKVPIYARLETPKLVRYCGYVGRADKFSGWIHLTPLHNNRTHSYIPTLHTMASSIPPPPVAPAQRIRELSEINKEVATMLNSAGHAVNALTDRNLNLNPSPDEDTQMTDDGNNTISVHAEQFTKQTEAYFTGLQSVFAQLRRQALALEEAGIISPDADSALATNSTTWAAATPAGKQGLAPPESQRSDVERLKNGGLGNFDIGYLNSRGNEVGEEKEAELVNEAKALLEEIMERNGSIG